MAQRIAQEWRTSTDGPLRLIGGDLDLAYVTAFYLPDRPLGFPVAYPAAAPGVNDARIKREGIVLVCYLHWDEPHCLHDSVRKAIDHILARTPAARRVEISIPGTPRGVRGQYPGFIIFTVSPQE